MDLSNREMMSESDILRGHAQVWKYSLNFLTSISLKCAVELGIPDAIHGHGGQPMTLSQLAAALSIPVSKSAFLGRLVAFLMHSGFLATQKIPPSAATNQSEVGLVGYTLTPASRVLVKGDPWDMSPMVLFLLNPAMVEPSHCMGEWLKSETQTPSTPFHMKHGMTLWECLSRDEKLSRIMNVAMASDGPVMARLMMDKCGGVLEGLRSMVDVGGGTGGLAREIAGAFPEMMCTVLDLPHVVGCLVGTRNLKYVGGDMFEAVPSADACLLKWILHDWSDEDCVKILKQCKKALISNGKMGKVMIVDVVMADQPKEDETTIESELLLDLFMMVSFTGRERNEKEWQKLFDEAGFSDYKVTPLVGLRSLIEVFP